MYTGTVCKASVIKKELKLTHIIIPVFIFLGDCLSAVSRVKYRMCAKAVLAGSCGFTQAAAKIALGKTASATAQKHSSVADHWRQGPATDSP